MVNSVNFIYPTYVYNIGVWDMGIKNTNSGREAPDWRELFLTSLPRGQITEKYLSKDGQQLEVFLAGKDGKTYRINAEMHERYGFMALIQSLNQHDRNKSKWEIYVGKGKLMVFRAFNIRGVLKFCGYKWDSAHKAWTMDISKWKLQSIFKEIRKVLALKGAI